MPHDRAASQACELTMEVIRPGPDDNPSIAHIRSMATERLRLIYKPASDDASSCRSDKSVSTCLVARIGGRTVGVVEYIETPGAMHFQGLAVDPRHYNNGVARRLVSSLEALCRDKNCPLLSLATIEETGNVEIFIRLGFHVVGRALTNRYLSDQYQALHIVNMAKGID